MPYKNVFKRHELKYMLTRQQKQRIVAAMAPYMNLDKYGRITIRNLYFDTDNYRLIRRSIEKPVYKEKLRIRSYVQAAPDSPVFVELKKKYKSVVYKRRISLPEKSAIEWLCGHSKCEKRTQISAEIDYFMSYYENMHPTVFLSYDREAYYSLAGDDFRVTFDDNVLCRSHNLSLQEDVGGIPILDDDKVLMEIKCSGGMPLWMAEILSRERLYKTSFSKYGTAYKTLIYPKIKEDVFYA